MTVEELDDMEAATVHVKVDVSLFEIGRDRLTKANFRMKLFDLTPCGIANAFAVNMGRNKQKFQVSSFAIYLDHGTADRLSVTEDPVGFIYIDRPFDRLARDDLIVFFKMIVSSSELFQCAVVKCFLWNR